MSPNWKSYADILPDDSDFNHGSALNINIISGFICQRLQSSCKAPQATLDACERGKAAASGKTGQAAADAFNGALRSVSKRDAHGRDGNGNGRGNGIKAKILGGGNGRGRNRGNNGNNTNNGNNGNRGRKGNNGNGGNNGNNGGNGVNAGNGTVIDDGANNGNQTVVDGGANNGNDTVVEDPAADDGAADDAADDAADCVDGSTDDTAGNGDDNADNGNNNDNGNDNANNGDTGNDNTDTGNNNGGGNTGNGALDFGICTDPTMSRAAGRPGRKADEFTFFPTNSDGNFGGQSDALNPAIIANFICDTFTNKCKASQAALDTCRQAQAGVVAANAAGKRDQSVADAFNAALGF